MNDGKRRSAIIDHINRTLGDMELTRQRVAKADQALETVLLVKEAKAAEIKRIHSGRREVIETELEQLFVRVRECTESLDRLHEERHKDVRALDLDFQKKINDARSELGTAQAEYDRLVKDYDAQLAKLQKLLPHSEPALQITVEP